MNKLVAGGAIVLVVLIAFTLFLSSFIQRSSSPTGENPTPIPTQSISQGGTPRSFQTIIKEKNQGLLPNQQNGLNRLRSQLPHTQDSFDMDYAPEIDTYVIHQKDPDNDDFKDFLSENGVLDVYLAGSNAILVSNVPIATTIQGLKDDIINDAKHNHDEDEDKTPTEAPAAKSKEEQVFTDSGKTLLSFNFGGPKPKSASPSVIGQIILPPNIGGPNAQGYYQMPEPTADEYVFGSGTCPAQRWGQKELVGTIYTVALAWKVKYPDSRLRVGDLNASGHNSHRWGVAVDITTSNQSGANTGGSRERNVELGKMFVNTNLIKNIWFCDNGVNAEVMGYARANNLSLQQMSCVSGHNDHFHVDITNPRGPESTPGC